MNHMILLFSLLFPVLCDAAAETYPSNQNNSPSGSHSQLSFVVVLLVLILMVVLSIFIAIYTRFCLRIGSAGPNNNQLNPTWLTRPGAISSGIDRTVIESLPFFKFSALRGLRGGLECAVCLSKFEEVEVLRLLPKCKHAFHISCIDQWLENHSSCPLCRQRIGTEDLTLSNSLRFLSSQSEVREGSNMELFVQREDSRPHGSSRFTIIGSSFRKFGKGIEKDDKLPIQEKDDKFLHKFNHKIIMCDAALKSRWSNLSSSDLMLLSSEMLGDVSSNRFSTLDSNTLENSATWATEEGEISKISSHPVPSDANTSDPTRNFHSNGKRSMSEIVVHPRFKEVNLRNNSFRQSSVPANATKEERLKRLWLPIAQKTVRWYSNRDKKSQQMNYTREQLNV